MYHFDNNYYVIIPDVLLHLNAVIVTVKQFKRCCNRQTISVAASEDESE